MLFSAVPAEVPLVLGPVMQRHAHTLRRMPLAGAIDPELAGNPHIRNAFGAELAFLGCVESRQAGSLNLATRFRGFVALPRRRGNLVGADIVRWACIGHQQGSTHGIAHPMMAS